MSEIVEFPGSPSDRPITEEASLKSFRRLEEKVCDLDRWTELANSLIGDCACDERSWRELEIASLVVERLSKLVGDLKHDYYRAWKGQLYETADGPA